MFLLLAVLSLIIKPILVSSICFVKRHFSSSSLKLEKKSSFWVELFMWLNNAMCPYKWEHHWLSCLLICLYWKPDLCQQAKHELLIQFKSSVAPPGLAVIPWGFFFFKGASQIRFCLYKRYNFFSEPCRKQLPQQNLMSVACCSGAPLS